MILALVYRLFFSPTHTHVRIGKLVSLWSQVKCPIRWTNQCCFDASLTLLYDSPVLPRVAFARQKGRLCIERDMHPLFTALLCMLLTQVKSLYTCQMSIG